jgi:hypothetical protein
VSNSTDHVWDDSDSNKPTEKVVIPQDSDELVAYNAELAHDFDEILPGIAAFIRNNPQLPEDSESVLALAAARIGQRAAGYTRENAFSHIARRWNVWMENRGEKFRFSPCDVAALMVDFKLGRMEARLPKVKVDDLVDAAGYIEFVNELKDFAKGK